MTPVPNDASTRIPANDRNTLAAYFRNPDDGEKAISDLSAAGFSKKDIGVALWDRNLSHENIKTAPAAGLAQRFRSMFTSDERDEYASEEGLDVLNHMGLSEAQGRYFKNALHSGGVLVTVNPGTRSSEAISVLRRHNAITPESISSTDLSRADVPRESVQEGGQEHIQLLGEVLRVHKDRVQRGSVTLRKEVVSERQNIEVPVSHEELVIERHPAGEEAPGATFQNQKEIRVPLSEERVRTEKRPVVREDIGVGKRTVQDTEKISDDVRHEELKVEKEGEVSKTNLPRKKAS